jgi:pimeloyl-ACP methyl ester carboxylesterase
VSEELAQVDGIEIAYETIGDPGGQPLLMIMGLGTQMIHWDIELCELLAARGFHVIRFDNRDVGHSTKIDAPVPNVRRAMVGLRVDAPYLLRDMADDTAGLLDHLGIPAAHVVGASMGGMIAQTLAIERPDRVLSLTSIMSTTGNRRVGQPKLRVTRVLLRRAPREKDAFVEHFVRVFRLIGSPGFDYDEERLRQHVAEAYERDHDSNGSGRQLAAILASGDRTARLRELRVPTTVIHGDKDPLVPIRGGRATARAIPDAELIAIPGMGHDMPRAVWPQLVDAISDTAARASASVSGSSEPAVSS